MEETPLPQSALSQYILTRLIHERTFEKRSRALYFQQRDKGASHYTALRAPAYKWIRIIWRCRQDRKPYCDYTYIKALQRTQSPLVPAINELLSNEQKT